MTRNILSLGVSVVVLVLSLSASPAAEAKPLHHIVLVNFKDDVSSPTIQRILEEFALLPSKVPGVLGFQWGTDNSPEGLQKGFTHGFFMTFESAGALDAYIEHPDHQAFVGILRPAAEDLFVCDFLVDEAPPAAVPGRVRHLVFFKYKDGTSAEDVERIEAAFASLTTKIPGLLRYESGPNTALERGKSKGLTHAFALTFVNRDARDDYLPHPAHKAFGGVVGPVLDDVLVLDFTVRPAGRGLLVTGGLEPYRVYQRGDDDSATLEFRGLAAGDGPIEARVLSGRRTVAGLDWKRVGKAEGGMFSGVLAGVRTGGEYTVELRRRDALGNVAEVTDVPHILVGDVWVLAGQSNMEGVGNLRDVEKPHPLVHDFTMAHRWELAVEPLHWLSESRDPVHLSRRFAGKDEAGRRELRASIRASRTKGAGLGLPFARHLVEATGVPVGLISAAHGRTSMTQWDPAAKDRGGESLYGSMLKQVRRAGGKVKGVLWYQGESDANPGAAPMFKERFAGLIAAMREDFGNDELPFYYVQIGRFVIDGVHAAAWKQVQEVQRTLHTEISNTAVVSVIDLALDDLIHVGTPGLKRVGARLAKIARRELFGETGLDIGPRLAGVAVSDGGRTIRVRFSRVNGRLTPAEQVLGFSIRGPDGGDVATVYNAAVDPERPSTVVLKLQRPAPDGATLWYGAGLDPICNLADSEDMAALVFGPIEIE